MSDSLSLFVKEMRKRFGLTQVDLAAKAEWDFALCASWSKESRLYG